MLAKLKFPYIIDHWIYQLNVARDSIPGSGVPLDLGRNAIWKNGRSCFTPKISCIDQHMLQTRYLHREIRAESRAHGSGMWASSHSLPCHGWSNQEKTSRFKLIQPLVKLTNRSQFHHLAEIPSSLARSSQDPNPRTTERSTMPGLD